MSKESSLKFIKTQRGMEIPLSPFNLLQEIYVSDPWKILVCCIFLNQTRRKQVDQIREDFFEKWRNPQTLKEANLIELTEFIKPLGFCNRRARTLLNFSRDWLEKDWKSPLALTGIGEYGLDSWKIFVEGEIVKEPSDHVLKDYIEWRTNLNFSILKDRNYAKNFSKY